MTLEGQHSTRFMKKTLNQATLTRAKYMKLFRNVLDVVFMMLEQYCFFLIVNYFIQESKFIS